MKGNGLKRECLEFESFRLYTDERLLLKGGKRVPLTPRVLDLLIVLVSHRGEVVSKESLLETVWPDSYVEEGNINKAVSTLRKNLGIQANGSDFIETVPKIGYRFIAPANKVAEEPEPEILSLPWAEVRRPVFWATAIVGILLVGILASSYVPSRFGKHANDGQNDSVAQAAENEPVRLTNDLGRHAFPMWTEDRQIRYQYYGGKKYGEPYIMDSNGENKTRINRFPGLRQGDWAPNGQRLLFWKENDSATYLMDGDGSNEKKLPFDPGNLAWSAKGERIVFQHVVLRGKTKDWEISTYDLATEKVVNVTNHSALDADPTFSADGKHVVFVSNRDGNFEIYLMNSDGSEVRRLTEHPAWDSHPVFSPDGTQIIFNSNRENENYDLYLMNADGSHVTKLTDWESDEEIGPGCWSPDGTKITFMSNRSGNDDIYVVNVEPFRPQLFLSANEAEVSAAVFSPDGKQIAYQAELEDKTGELRMRDIENGQVSTLQKTANANLRPAWSADGSRIAFQNKIGGATALFRIDADGSNPARITYNETSNVTPSWSPDGMYVAFVADNYGSGRLFTVNTSTGEQQALTPNEGWEGDPVWSPDGTKIVFACDRQDIPGNALDICLIEADGQNEKRLLSRHGHDVQPSWSPDGLHIAFVAASDGNNEIYVMKSNGTGLVRLTRNPANDVLPHWSPDGRRIIFTSDRSGRSAIYEIAL